MNNTVEFIPRSKPLHPYIIWIMMALICGACLLIGASLSGTLPAPFVLCGVVILLFSGFKFNTRVLVDVAAQQLIYEYMNSWGKIRSIYFILPKVKMHYRPEQIGRSTRKNAWILTLRQGNRLFGKEVSLTYTIDRGFTKVQLDELATLVRQGQKQ